MLNVEMLKIMSEQDDQPTGGIDIARTRWIMTAWPNGRLPEETYAFIEKMTDGVKLPRKDHRVVVKKKDRTCARNTAIRDEALGSHEHYQWFVFIDNDVRPRIETPQFLFLPADIKCCQVPMRMPAAWSRPDSFHESIWCTSRAVLEAIAPPWFMQEYTEDGCNHRGCICQYFRKKATEAGFSIAHGGWANHDQDGSWH